jgi:hypothetical protein
MRKHAKVLITALTAAATLAALVSTATARNLSTSERSFRVTYSSLEFTSNAANIRCGLTLEGSFHTRTIVKSVGALLGYLTRAIIRRPCTGGTMWAHSGETNEVLGSTVANNLPWHIQYGGFAGTLPNISSARLVFPGNLVTIRASLFGISTLCEYVTTNANGNWISTLKREAGGALTTLRASGRIRSNSGGFCPEIEFVSAEADGTVTGLNAGARITMTLI